MATVQSVSPWFNFDNIKVVKTDIDYLVDKNDLVIMSTKVGTIIAPLSINVTLPSNPEAGESHRFVSPAAGTINIHAQAGSQISFNPSDSGVVQAPSCIVQQGGIVDVTWSDSASGWIASCCATAVPQ